MKNAYIYIDENTIEVSLTQGQVCLIDACDMALVGEYKWCAHKEGKAKKYYVRASLSKVNGKRKFLGLHRLIMSVTNPKIKIDHIDMNPLNNRKSNLRLATASQNGYNQTAHLNSKTGVKNISWHKQRNKYVLYIKMNGKAKHYGYFDTIEEAIAKRDELLPLLHKEFANNKDRYNRDK